MIPRTLIKGCLFLPEEMKSPHYYLQIVDLKGPLFFERKHRKRLKVPFLMRWYQLKSDSDTEWLSLKPFFTRVHSVTLGRGPVITETTINGQSCLPVYTHSDFFFTLLEKSKRQKYYGMGVETLILPYLLYLIICMDKV